MTNRDWFCLALRLFGIWILIQAIEQTVPYLLFYLSRTIGVGGFQAFIAQAIWLACRTALALVLIMFAPAITERFYPSAEPSVTDSLEVNETRALRVGIKLLAVYALLLAVQSVGSIVYSTLILGVPSNFMSSEHGYIVSFLTCGLNLAFAAILLIWNEQIITFIERFRFVAERDGYEPPPIDE